MKTTNKSITGLACAAIDRFNNAFGAYGEKVVYFAPASLILLGDHTHYNDGNIITCSIDKYVCVVLGKNEKDEIAVITENTEQPVIVHAGENHFEDFKFPIDRILQLLGLVKENYAIPPGLVCSITSDITGGLGLGSTAAFSVAFLNALNKLLGLKIDEPELINIAYQTEFNSIGKITNKALIVASMLSRENKIMNFDFRSDKINSYDFNHSGFSIIVCDTKKENVKNTLCQERITECEVGVKGLRLYIWGIKNLRDVNLDFLEKHIHMLPRRVYKRCYYNVMERIRVDKALEYLLNNDTGCFGQLLTESHTGLSTDYEISTEELDFLVEESAKVDGVVGSKLISCSPKLLTVHIIKTANKEEVIEQLGNSYRSKYDSELIVYNVNLSNGLFEFSDNNHIIID